MNKSEKEVRKIYQDGYASVKTHPLYASPPAEYSIDSNEYKLWISGRKDAKEEKAKETKVVNKGSKKRSLG